MNQLAVLDKGADWSRLKALVLDSASSPISKRVYNLAPDEFFAWYGQVPRPGFTEGDHCRLARGPRGPPARGGFHQRKDHGGPRALAVEARR